jgi:hypothetical protein
MSSKERSTSQVFLTYGGDDKAVAAAIKQKMKDAGLNVFALSDTEWEKEGKERTNLEKTVLQAMLRSSAFIALLSETRQDSPTLAFTFGAARGSDKDIYVLAADNGPAKPVYLRRYPAYTVQDLPKIMPELLESSRH